MQNKILSDTQSNRQIWCWRTKWSTAKANRVLSREHTGHSKYTFPTTQEMTLHTDVTRWSISKSDWFYFLQPKMEKLYKSAKTRPGADCGSDHQFLIEKFRLTWKKVGKIIRPFRYDLNQICSSQRRWWADSKERSDRQSTWRNMDRGS